MCYHEEKSVAPQVAEQRKDAKGNMTDTFFIVGIVLMVIGYFLFFQAQSLRTTEQRKKLERTSVPYDRQFSAQHRVLCKCGSNDSLVWHSNSQLGVHRY